MRYFILSSTLTVLMAVMAPPVHTNDLSGQAKERSSRGASVTREVPFAFESFDDIHAALRSRPQKPQGDRAIPTHRISSGTSGSIRTAAPRVAAAPAAPAPLATTTISRLFPEKSFPGLTNPPPSLDVVPPDTMGAAGLVHLVSLLNSEFGVFDKSTGDPLEKVGLQSFWASLGTDPGEPANSPFDTKVLYDQHSGRFVAVTLGGRSAPGSWVMIAVSSSDNALGSWGKWAIDADRDQDQQLFNNWADFPSLGLDSANLYVTANMYDASNNPQYSKIWVIPKAQLLPVPPPDNNNITWTEIRDPRGAGFSMQPAHVFGIAPAEYFVYEGGNGLLQLAWIDNRSGTPTWHPPVPVPVASYSSVNDLPDAPQAGDRGIDTADTRILNAVYRNGSLWATHHVLSQSGRLEIAWYRINPSTGGVTMQGRIGDPDRWYYYPSIGVNKDDIAGIGFSGSSLTEFVGGYFTLVWPSYGVSDNVSQLKPGVASYFKTLSGTLNRWGDFSATVVDPADDTSFWTLQEYAEAPIYNPHTSLDVSQWGTWWGMYDPSGLAPPPPPPLPPPTSSGGGCLSVSPSHPGAADAGTVLSALLLLLPAALCRWKRGKRGIS